MNACCRYSILSYWAYKDHNQFIQRLTLSNFVSIAVIFNNIALQLIDYNKFSKYFFSIDLISII